MEPKTTSALLYLDGITVSFDGFRALNELSFVIEPREMRDLRDENQKLRQIVANLLLDQQRSAEPRRKK